MTALSRFRYYLDLICFDLVNVLSSTRELCPSTPGGELSFITFTFMLSSQLPLTSVCLLISERVYPCSWDTRFAQT